MFVVCNNHSVGIVSGEDWTNYYVSRAITPVCEEEKTIFEYNISYVSGVSNGLL